MDHNWRLVKLSPSSSLCYFSGPEAHKLSEFSTILQYSSQLAKALRCLQNDEEQALVWEAEQHTLFWALAYSSVLTASFQSAIRTKLEDLSKQPSLTDIAFVQFLSLRTADMVAGITETSACAFYSRGWILSYFKIRFLSRCEGCHINSADKRFC